MGSWSSPLAGAPCSYTFSFPNYGSLERFFFYNLNTYLPSDRILSSIPRGIPSYSGLDSFRGSISFPLTPISNYYLHFEGPFKGTGRCIIFVSGEGSNGGLHWAVSPVELFVDLKGPLSPSCIFSTFTHPLGSSLPLPSSLFSPEPFIPLDSTPELLKAFSLFFSN